MNALEVAGLRRAFRGRAVLDGAALVLETGSVTALLGSSGSGKSTLLRAVTGFDRVDGGTIAVAGRPVAGPALHVPPERRRIGYVPQDGALFPHLTVAANIGFGLPRAERRGPRVAELLALTGLSGLEARYPAQLSGGQQQRTALARALAPRPALVLLDEPFTALDLHLRRSVCAEVVDMLRRAGATALLVTHDPAEAFGSADRVALLCDGTVVQHDTPEAVYRRPATEAAARLTGAAMLLPGIAAGPRADTALGPVELAEPCQGPVRVLLRPEQVVLAATGVAATVAKAVFLGDRTALTLDVAGLAVQATVAESGLSAGDRVGVAVAGAAKAFPAA